MKQIIVLLAMLLLLSCGQTTQEEATKVQPVHIATSVFPVYDIVQRVAGNAQLTYVVPAGANPHTFQPAPETVKKLQNVSLFLGVHPDFDGWVERFLPEGCSVHYFLPEGEVENPHVWLSLKGGKEIAHRVSEVLGERFPEKRQELTTRLADFEGEIERAQGGIDRLFAEVKNPRFIQWHPAWDRFARAHGLEIIGTIEHGHGHEPAMRDFQDLVETARATGTRVVVIGLHVQSRAAESLVQEIDGELVHLDSIGGPDQAGRENWLSLMQYNAKLLADALSR